MPSFYDSLNSQSKEAWDVLLKSFGVKHHKVEWESEEEIAEIIKIIPGFDRGEDD